MMGDSVDLVGEWSRRSSWASARADGILTACASSSAFCTHVVARTQAFLHQNAGCNLVDFSARDAKEKRRERTLTHCLDRSAPTPRNSQSGYPTGTNSDRPSHRLLHARHSAGHDKKKEVRFRRTGSADHVDAGGEGRPAALVSPGLTLLDLVAL